MDSWEKEQYVYPIQTRTKSMVGHKTHEDIIPQKDGTEMRRTIWDWRSHGTYNISTQTPTGMESPQCVSCNVTETLHQNRNTWRKLHKTSTWTPRRTRSVWSQNNCETLKKEKRVSIFHQMERIPDWRSNVGTRRKYLQRQRHADMIQTSTSTLTWWSRQLSRRQSRGLSSNHHEESKPIIWHPLSPPSNHHKSPFTIHKDNTSKTWMKIIKRPIYSIDLTNKTSNKHHYLKYSQTFSTKWNDYQHFFHPILFLQLRN